MFLNEYFCKNITFNNLLTFQKMQCSFGFFIFIHRKTKMNVFVLITFALLVSEIEAGWKNRWDSQLNFRCSSDASSIYQFVSTHHNHYEDRLFDFNCRKVRSVSGSVSCSWSGIVAIFIISFV